jgi:membrane protease YdiL (CAAX protease family)
MAHLSPMILTGIVVAAAAVGFGWLAIRHWRSQGYSIIDCLGLRWDRRSSADLLVGFTIAALVMLGIFACEIWSGGITRAATSAVTGMPSWQATLLMMVTAPEEEIVNRSLLLSGLAIALGGRSRTAILLTAVAFGLAHLTNPGSSAASGLGNGLGGLIYGYAFVMSGRIWLPVGLHFAWNFVQGPLLGFPVSGLAMGGVQQIHDLGPAWLTGGSYGPEAGAVGISFRFVELALVVLYVNLNHNKGRSRKFEESVASASLEMITTIQCSCGAVEMRLIGKPMMQYVCHCDDCQAVHGKAYACSLYPAAAVSVERGETDTFTLKTSPRTKCKRCGTYLFAEVPGYGVRGVNAAQFPEGMFSPEFHIQCRYATAPVEDNLPHYKGTPARFNGSDELMSW